MEAKTNTFLETEKSVGTAVTLCIIVSLVLTAVYFIFRHPILVMFGGEVNQETYACAKEYFTQTSHINNCFKTLKFKVESAY